MIFICCGGADGADFWDEIAVFALREGPTILPRKSGRCQCKLSEWSHLLSYMHFYSPTLTMERCPPHKLLCNSLTDVCHPTHPPWPQNSLRAASVYVGNGHVPGPSHVLSTALMGAASS